MMTRLAATFAAVTVFVAPFVTLSLGACSSTSDSNQGGSSGAGAKASANKKCFKSKSGYECKCKADPGYEAPKDVDGEPFEPVDACDPGITNAKPYCCAGEKNGVERCTCEALLCKSQGTTGCDCGRIYNLGDGPYTEECPKPAAGIHCCNRLGEANCSCSSMTCADRGEGYEEMPTCTVDVMVKECDGVDKPAPSCLFPSEQ
jgi:hypothetical protein